MKFIELPILNELPKSVSNKEIIELFQKYYSGDIGARDKIISHNARLVIYEITRRFSNTGYDIDDLFSIGIIGLIKATDSFDVSKNILFATYATRCIDNEILMFIRKYANEQEKLRIEEGITGKDDVSGFTLVDCLQDSSVNIVDDYENKEVRTLIRTVVQQLPSEERNLMSLYFGFDNNRPHTQSELGKMFNKSQSLISRKIKTILLKIKKDIINLEIEVDVNHQKVKK